MRRGRSLSDYGDLLRRRRLYERLRSELDAEAFVNDALGLNDYTPKQGKRGTELVHSCILPFGMHRGGDQNPSASFNVDIMTYNCFTCGGGDLLWLTSNVLEVEVSEALSMLLARIDNRNFSASEFMEQLGKLWGDPDQISFEMPHYPAALVERWARVTRYMTQDRGVAEQVQRDLLTGIDLQNREKVRLSSGNEFWVEQARITIPHFFEGVLRGWQKRRVFDGEIGKGPKYRSSPGLPKDRSLYNYDRVDPRRPVIVVESPMSALRLMSHGYDNVVATLGAEVTPTQVNLMRRFDETILAFDGDPGGNKASHVVSEDLMRTNTVYVCSLPEDTDPGDLDRQGVEGLIDSKQIALIWTMRN